MGSRRITKILSSLSRRGRSQSREEAETAPGGSEAQDDSKSATPDASQTKLRWPTIRISRIPSGVKRDEFDQVLKRLSEDDGCQVLRWSLCPSAIFELREHHQVATVTFKDRIPTCFQGPIATLDYGQIAIDSELLGLTPLYCPAADETVDIIAVTGLAGHAFGSWRSRTEPSMWLRDFIPLVAPSARILVYGYETELSESRSHGSILDYARTFLEAVKATRRRQATPLIFIAHSLGGLVVKQALVNAAQGSSKDKQIIRSCYGLVLFGVPSRGLEIEALRSMVKGQPNEKLIGDLGVSSPFLDYLHDMFYRCFTWEDSRIISLYERDETATVELRDGVWKRTGPTALMVPRHSAIYHSRHDQPEDILPIYADHSCIVKFPNQFDRDYLMVQARIKDMVEYAPNVIWERIHQTQGNAAMQNVSFKIPPDLAFPRNPNFTGRRKELERIHKILGRAGPDDASRNVVVLYGLGGVGKTQLALQYAYTNRKHYSSVWWFNCATRDAFSQSFLSISHELVRHYKDQLSILGLEELALDKTSEEAISRTVDAVKRWFEIESNTGWLLILDNLDDLEEFDSTKIPRSHGTIIVTSRLKDAARLGYGIEMAAMEKDDSVELLLRSSGYADSQTPETYELATELAEILGHLPLALDQAGAYIFVRKMTIKQYLAIYEANFSQLFTEQPKVWDYKERTVYTTWKISLDAIEIQNPEATELFFVCSFFSNEDISESMLRRGLHVDDESLEFADRLHLLSSYSLIRRQDGNSFSIHPVVHQWAQSYLEPGVHSQTAQQALQILSTALIWPLPNERTNEQWLFERRTLTHVRKLHDICQSYFHGWMRTPGFNKKLALTSIFQLGETYRFQGRLREAEELFVLVTEMRKSVLGAEHIDTLTSVDGLATIYWNQGRWGEAEKLEVETLKLKKTVLGPEHPSTLTSMRNLALTYKDQERWKEAEDLMLQAIEAETRLFGLEDTDTLLAMSNLATIYQKQERWIEAEDLNLQVMEARKRVLGPEHSDTLISISNLAVVYVGQQRWDEAEKLNTQVIDAAKKILGHDHPTTLFSMHNLAITYNGMGRTAEAVSLMGGVVPLLSLRLGDSHPYTKDAKSNLTRWALETQNDT